jgi:hypothetical protein
VSERGRERERERERDRERERERGREWQRGRERDTQRKQVDRGEEMICGERRGGDRGGESKHCTAHDLG